MSDDDENRFRPKPGRIRSDTPKAGKAKSFLTQAKKLARQQGNAHSRYSPRSGSGKAGKSGKASPGAGGPGIKRGRGASFVRARSLSGGWRHSTAGVRRVVVKTRYVQQAGKNGKAAAHLRYIQRDGTSRDGERGQLYSANDDRAEPQAFLDRGRDDRHQFRFIVSPEDGVDLADLTEHTRDLMSSIEADLGTRLDWVAVNHYNTGQPHVHVIVNGRDDKGADLVINGDYLANGIRERASELATLELGPVTEIEQSRKLSTEIDQDRFTRIDRAMTAEADDRLLDLRHEPDDPRRQFNRTLRLRRLARLEKMGLATEHAPGVWELGAKMEPALRELGERGDIIRNMHKALKADGLERDPMTFQLHDAAPTVPITGRVVDKYLTDEMGEKLTLVVDGIDGRTHHVPGIDPARVEDARIGSIIEVGPADTAARPSDRTIATIAEDGLYRPSRHLEQARFEGRVPGGDYEGYVDSHVRRLEALRRAGIVERIDADQWRIPEDFASRAATYDAGRNRQASIRVVSTVDVEKQIGADGATWLDRRLMTQDASDLAPAGFGQQVREAMDQRREHHIEQGDANRQQGGRVFYRRNLLATLREREVARVGAELAESKGLPFRAAADGENISGKFTGTAQLSSGKFAVVEKSREFTLVPWRPVIDRQLGREVAGVVQGGSVSWQLGRSRGLGI
ncbi:type IV secretory pathway VirD2 relaxase [Amaricoccus macauensis]|uniref:Type IV secretory pathway VirD2 relaxase n=1 Tax=Amaricoccus macauensis TaxID=57001 RepID=A0A840SJA5_9RHOB|nr:type IV secretory pathway VirD2 relaxase [Amaricoccus macauensis]